MNSGKWRTKVMSPRSEWRRISLAGTCALGLWLVTSTTAVAQTAAGAAAADTTTTDEATTDDAGGPAFGCDEPTHDFGEFWAGPKMKHTFEIKNTGTEVLKILKVKPACGCTLAGAFTKEIAPGETGQIPLSLTTKNLGRSKKKFTKRVTVTTNDPNSETAVLNLTGLARQPVDVTPPSVQFGSVKYNAELTRTVQITNNLADPLTLELLQTQSGKFKAELVEIEPGKKFELIVTGNPPYDEGRNLTKFSLTTNVTDQPTLNIQAYASVKPRFQLTKKSITIPKPQSIESSHSITFINNGDTPITISSAEVVDDDSVTTTITEREAGKRYVIQVQFPADYLPPEKGTKLVLHTNDEQKPTIDIPIQRQAARKPAAKRKPRPAEQLVGKKAPSVQLLAISGRPIDTGNPQGKVLVLDFWASWCGYCKKQIPVLQEIYEEYKNNPDIEFVAVSLDTEQGRRATTPQKVKDKFAELGATFDLVLDPSKSAGTPFKATSFPTLFLIGKTGNVEAVQAGFSKATFKSSITQKIDKLLAGESLAKASKIAKTPVQRIQIPVVKGIGPPPMGTTDPTAGKGSGTE